ncbi:MAG: hypothetical protein ACP59X_00925 [Solidesulfovibrio sp. DCME]|uniref:hypothetical protein n=1 Tax=Solidesulfovibrio sp. DCME TaxID=3447380 RepID=UPI003D0EC2B1
MALLDAGRGFYSGKKVDENSLSNGKNMLLLNSNLIILTLKEEATNDEALQALLFIESSGDNSHIMPSG